MQEEHEVDGEETRESIFSSGDERDLKCITDPFFSSKNHSDQKDLSPVKQSFLQDKEDGDTK